MSDVPTLAVLPSLLIEQESPSRFHMVDRLLEGQEPLTVPPGTPAREAIRIMRQSNRAQLPVVEGKTVLGLFTYRAFALEVVKLANSKIDPVSLPVEEFLSDEEPAYARLTDEFSALVRTLDRREAVVVSGPTDLLAVLTPMDVLRYLHNVANAFVLLEEIEHALRKLIRAALPTSDALKKCVENALSAKYKPDKLPRQIEEMTFDDYVGLLRDGRNWASFEPIFINRDMTRAKLESARDLRNVVFHFRRELSVDDHEQLSGCRNWLLLKIRIEQARRESGR